MTGALAQLPPHLLAVIVPVASITGSLADLATTVVSDLGLLGIFVLMLVESACIPIPSEVTMLFAGFGVSQGKHGLAAIVVAGTLGNLVGSWLAYAVGFYGGGRLLNRRAGRLLTHGNGLERAQRWFDRYGSASVLLARMLPFVRTFISLPAGIARMKFGRFSLFTLLGCIPWVLALAALGDVAGHNWTHWQEHLRYVDYAVLGIAVAAASLLIGRWHHRRSRKAS